MEATMLTQLFPKVHPRYTVSPSAHWLEGFSDWLTATGYAHKVAQHHIYRLKEVLERHRCVSLTSQFSAAALPVMFDHQRRQPLYRGTQRAFYRFLAQRGSLMIEPEPSRFSRLLARYRHHLTDLRGLSASTIDQHLATILDFLSQAVPVQSRLEDLSAIIVERFVGACGRRVSRQTLQHIVARLRAFLRYCHDQGVVRCPLDAIDTPRAYRDELPPRAVDWGHVQRLLDSVDVASKAGWRDLAMLHLMAHYGLRPSEVVALTIDAIDWRTQQLQVEQCKTRSTLVLPLTDRTVTILRRYLRHGRPPTDHRELFLRVRTPAGPLKHYAPGDVFKKHVQRSGLALQGYSAYSLRHAFAMRLLNRGVGIKAIGDLLGHRTLESTCVYLRLQTDALREVALPVPRLELGSVGRPS
jgi:site-specific recombinase XerD